MARFKQYLLEMTEYEKRIYNDQEKIYQDPEKAYYYARDTIKGRFLKAEPYIMKDPLWACLYVIDVMGTRWPEAEPFIVKDARYFKNYLDELKSRHRRQIIYKNVIEHDPANIQLRPNPDKDNQELAIKIGGKRIIPLIKNLDPEIKKQYPEIINLKRSGLFR